MSAPTRQTFPTRCSCGLIHLGTHHCGGTCSCVDAYRLGPDGLAVKEIENGKLRWALVTAFTFLWAAGFPRPERQSADTKTKSPLSRKSPGLLFERICEESSGGCGEFYKARNKQSRWCDDCRERCYAEAQAEGHRVRKLERANEGLELVRRIA